MIFVGTLGPPNVEVVPSTSTPTALNPRGAGTSDPFFPLFLPVSLLPFILYIHLPSLHPLSTYLAIQQALPPFFTYTYTHTHTRTHTHTQAQSHNPWDCRNEQIRPAWRGYSTVTGFCCVSNLFFSEHTLVFLPAPSPEALTCQLPCCQGKQVLVCKAASGRGKRVKRSLHLLLSDARVRQAFRPSTPALVLVPALTSETGSEGLTVLCGWPQGP